MEGLSAHRSGESSLVQGLCRERLFLDSRTSMDFAECRLSPVGLERPRRLRLPKEETSSGSHPAEAWLVSGEAALVN